MSLLEGNQEAMHMYISKLDICQTHLSHRIEMEPEENRSSSLDKLVGRVSLVLKKFGPQFSTDFLAKLYLSKKISLFPYFPTIFFVFQRVI